MSDVRNRANSLDVSFPIPGVNNSSQGFRDNTIVTQQALFRASDELSKIQNTQLLFVGDAQGSSGRFDSAVVVGNNTTLEVSFNLSNTLPSAQAFNSNTGDVSLTFDIKGRLIGYQEVGHVINMANGHVVNQLIPVVGNIGSGSGFITLPVFGFNELGRLTITGNQNIEFGLQNQTLDQGSLLVGGQGNLSTSLEPPSGSGTFVLSSTGSNLGWFPLTNNDTGSISGGQGISVTSTLGVSSIDLDLDNLDSETSLTDSDLLAFQDISDDRPKNITFGDIRNVLNSGIEVVLDTSPQLGGSLDVQDFNITSTGTSGVTIASRTSSPKTLLTVSETGMSVTGDAGTAIVLQAPSLTLNGLIFPTTSGLPGQVLSRGPGSELIWSAGVGFQQTFPRTIFVSNSGSDALGNGSFGQPYSTITRALTAVPNNVTDSYTIILLGGEYVENIDIQNKQNISIEGFFGSTSSIIKGNVQVLFNVDNLLMSKLIIDTSDDEVENLQSAFSILGGVGKATFKDCSFLRGPGPKSDLTAIFLTGQLGGNIYFSNCIIQGKIDNSSQAGSNQVVFQNCGLPEDGWTGLFVGPESSTLISGAPLIKGIEHHGGVLVVENVSSVLPESYTISIENPSLPLWEGGRPKFLTNFGNAAFDDDILSPGEELLFNQEEEGNVETLLLDPTANPVPDPTDPGQNLTTPWIQFLVDQPDTVETYTVGLFSKANSDTSVGEDRLELTNVSFYNSGSFSRIYKEGSCEWSFNRVQRRSDQDLVLGPRITHEVQPDLGSFIGQYSASGTNLRFLDSNMIVPGGTIDATSGNTFLVKLTNSATLTLRTPPVTGYSPGPDLLSGEFYTELLIGVQQDSAGYRQVNFLTSSGDAIEWLSDNSVGSSPNSITFYLFRYFSRSRTWVGQKHLGNSGAKIRPTTDNTYTLVSTDANSYIRCANTGTNKVIVPLNTQVEFNVGTQIRIIQAGVGSTEIEPAPGVIVNTPLGYRLRSRYSTAILTKVAINIWDLSGDLDPTQSVTPILSVDSNLITIDDNNVNTTGS